MYRRAMSIGILPVALSILCASSVAAQANRVFVSAKIGDDSNSCDDATTPCRSFAAALSQAGPGAEVIVIDSGSYEPFKVDKTVSVIVAPGVYAGITVSFGLPGVEITVRQFDVVVLRGLTINGRGGNNGITNLSGGDLHVENCAINGFPAGAGVWATAGRVFVKDTTIKNCSLGVFVLSPCAACSPVDGLIERSRIENTGSAVLFQSGRLTIRDTVAAGNGNGFAASPNASSAEINIENCVVSSNRYSGIIAIASATSPATVRVSSSMITGNRVGLQQFNSAVLLSRKNNTVEGNTLDLDGTIGTYSPK